MQTSARIRAFQRKILSFYAKHGRMLPWRETTDPYSILVSEVMLQQTQAPRVVPYYRRWLARWPTVGALASANRLDVLSAWSGLGYNRRALHLLESSKMIQKDFGGNVFAALHSGIRLPGIGPYTRNAVLIFAKNEELATVDGNIRLVFVHELKLDPGAGEKVFWEVASDCLPAGRSRDWHNALMDYGAHLAAVEKIPSIRPSAQGKFEGSDRQVRGAIVRALIAAGEKGFTKAQLVATLETSEPARVKKNLHLLASEGMLRTTGARFTLA